MNYNEFKCVFLGYRPLCPIFIGQYLYFFCWHESARGAVLRPLEIRETLTSIPPMVPRTSIEAKYQGMSQVVNNDG